MLGRLGRESGTSVPSGMVQYQRKSLPLPDTTGLKLRA